jgi:N-acetylneuraminate synthase
MKFVCEVGYNHQGNINRAIDIIDAFQFCDVFKFQKMNPKAFLDKKRYKSPSPKTEDYFAATYGAHREALELTVEEHSEIKEYVESSGKLWSCSVCDLPSAADIIPLNPYYLKIPSCRCNNFGLIRYCMENYKGPIHVSTGMTSKVERQAVSNLSNNIVLYSCTSNYCGDGEVYMGG